MRIRMLLATAAVIVGFLFLVGVPSGTNRVFDSHAPDALYDWLTAQAVVGEGSPYEPFSDLGEIHAPEAEFESGPTSRPPGTILLQMPHAAVGPDVPLYAMGVITVVSAGVLAVAAVIVAGLSWWWSPVIAAALLSTYPLQVAIWLGSQGPLLAALVAISWMMMRQGDRWPAGIGVGVASTLKLFPGLLIPMLFVAGYRKTAVGAVGVFLGLNAAGLALPELNFADSLDALFAFGEHHVANPRNLSPGVPWPLMVVAVGLLVWWARNNTDVDRVMVVGSAAMLALSPVLWSHYFAAVAVPSVWVLARSRAWLVAAPIISLWWLSRTFGEKPLLVGILAAVLIVGLFETSPRANQDRQSGVVDDRARV